MQNSIHTNIWGYGALIEARSGCEYDTDTSEGFQLRCAGCHTGCGECHISRPNSVAGGFVDGHNFSAEPDMTNQCVACHGARIGIDYKGDLEGNQPDTHLLHGKKCAFCHDAEEMHGTAAVTNDSGHWEHRYEVADMTRCEDCHGDGLDDEWDNEFHNAHVDGLPGANLQCQVCHSQKYKNCTSCHPEPAGSEDPYTGIVSTENFKIGRNLNPNREEYDYVVVRHVPVTQNTYDDDMWGAGGIVLTDYDTVPTWKYTSPHNIRRVTAQVDTLSVNDCFKTCHASSPDNLGIYLLEEDLLDDEGTQLPDYHANLPVIID